MLPRVTSFGERHPWPKVLGQARAPLASLKFYVERKDLSEDTSRSSIKVAIVRKFKVRRWEVRWTDLRMMKEEGNGKKQAKKKGS